MSADLSVIMPLHDCAPWVERAVRSVLERADGLLELIVIDDGSTDAGPEIVASIDGPVRLIHQEHTGPAAARNAGLRVARGAIIGFLDADDVWIAEAPDLRRRAIEGGADVAQAKVHFVTGDPPRSLREPIHVLSLPSIFVRPRVFASIGLLDESITHGEDGDWFIRLKEAGLRPEFVDQTAFEYHRRLGSLTADHAASRSAIVNRVRDSMLRRGGTGGGLWSAS